MSQTKAQLISDLVQALAFTATASAPTNGMFLSATNELAISTNSTQRLTVDSSGDVAIGNTSADGRLHVRKDGTGEIIQLWQSDLGTNNRNIQLKSPSSDSATEPFTFATGNSFAVEIDSSEAFRIDSSGNVGIGVSSPSAFLDVESASDQTVLRLRNNGGNNTKLLFANKSAGLAEIFYQGDFRFVDDENSDAERLRIDSSGDLSVPRAASGYMFQTGNAIRAGIRSNDQNELIFKRGSDTTGMVLTSTGLGIGTTSPASTLHTSGSSDQTVTIQTTTSGADSRINFRNNSGTDAGGIFYKHNGNHLTFHTGGSLAERVRIDSTGRFFVGTSSAIASANNSSGNKICLSGAQTIFRSSSDTNSQYIEFIKERASGSIVSSGDRLGQILFEGHDGSDPIKAVEISSFVDGTPGTNDMPGRLVFSTTADGASSPTERMRIDSSGNLGVGDNDPPVRFSVTGSGDTHLGISSLHARIVDSSSFGTNVGGKLAFVGKINSSGTLAAFGAIHGGKEDNTNGANRGYLRFITRANGGDPSEAMRIDSGGNVGIGTTSPAALCHINKTSGTTLYRASVAGNSTIGLEIVKTGSTTQSWRIVDGQTVNGKLEFYDVTDSATRMCIDGSGKIGIGTTNPTADGLHIINSTQPDLFMGTSTNAEGFKIVYNNTDSVVGNVTNTPLRFVVNNSERMRIDSSGHMQIGTTSSDSFRLKVLNGAGTLARFTDGTSQTLDIRQASGGIELKNPNNGFISFNGSSSERVRISSDGQLLIAGTATGSNNCKLRVTGDEDQRFNSSSPPVRKRAISHTYTNLSTTATAMSQALISNACVVDVFLENIDADQAVFRFTSGRRQGSHHSYSLVSGSNSNCSVSLSTNVFTITGLGDGRTYTLTMSTGSITTAPTLKASSTATGTTRIAMYSVGAF